MPGSSTCILYHADSRKSVSLSRDGNRLSVTSQSANGPPQSQERQFGTDREAQNALKKLRRELEGRGYGVEADEEPAESMPVLPRLAPAPTRQVVATKPKAGKKRKPKARADREGIMVKLALGATGAAILGLALFLGWALFGPATLVGSWTCSRGPLLARIRMEGGQLQRVLTFEKDGTAFAVYPELGQWMKGAYTAADGKLRLSFDRQGSFEQGEEPSPNLPAEDYLYTIKRGMLELTDQEGSKVGYLRLAPQSEESAHAVLARIPKTPPPPVPISSQVDDEQAAWEEEGEMNEIDEEF